MKEHGNCMKMKWVVIYLLQFNLIFALLASKKYTKEDVNMKRAEMFINERGGVARAHFMTKFLLAIHGEYEYPSLFHLPTPIMFLQNDSPLSIFELSSSARIHLIPMMLCLNKRFRVGKSYCQI